MPRKSAQGYTNVPNQLLKHFRHKLTNKISSKSIFRQYSFLMLELMIALFLVGTFALPLAQFPMRAMREEFKSAHRMQAQRLADLSFSDFKESLHREEIPWKDLTSPKSKKTKLPSKEMVVSFDSLREKKFLLEKTIHSVGKKTKEGDEHRLVTFRVKITPLEKSIKLFRTKKKQVRSRVYTYQVLVSKPAAMPAQLETPEPIQPSTS